MQYCSASGATRARLGICLAVLIFLMTMSNRGFAQESFQSIEVHPDRSVTVRHRDPGAKEVMFAMEGKKPIAMRKDTSGVWSITTEPLAPDYYGYFFLADGIPQLDPARPSCRND